MADTEVKLERLAAMFMEIDRLTLAAVLEAHGNNVQAAASFLLDGAPPQCPSTRFKLALRACHRQCYTVRLYSVPPAASSCPCAQLWRLIGLRCQGASVVGVVQFGAPCRR
eukprot:COSAG06_NODE_26076_length_622_cov_0.984704_2_plen_111_part_00